MRDNPLLLFKKPKKSAVLPVGKHPLGNTDGAATKLDGQPATRTDDGGCRYRWFRSDHRNH